MGDTEVKRLVIVGGGVAGHSIAHRLQAEALVALVDPKDYFEVPMAMPRQIVSPGELHALFPFREFLPKVSLVRASAAEVQRGLVVTDRGERVPFDIALFATGSNYRSELVKPRKGDVQSRLSFYREMNAALANARRILVVGGGPIGVELCGEILEDYPGKQVTLVEGASGILPRSHPRVRRWATRFLSRRGAVILAGRNLLRPEPETSYDLGGGVVETSQGDTIEYDLAFWCTGAKADAGYLTRHFSDAVNERGEIRVDRHFRVRGEWNMFAIGDATDIVHKGAVSVHAQYEPVLTNLRRVLKRGRDASLKPFSGVPMADGAIVTLGRRNGVLQMPFFQSQSPRLARLIKADDMLTSHFHKDLGLRRHV